MKNNNFNVMRSDYPPLPTLPMPASRVDPSKMLVVAELLKEPGNEVCADCSAAINMENAWAVLSYGILVCDDCKLVHIEHQNHYKSPDVNDPSADASTSGILSTQFAHVWEEKDVVQIKNNGNKKTNANWLKNSPVWQYRPSANDGIKLKEHWIKCKYSGNAGEAAENPAKIVSKKQFIGFQFIRPTPKGETYHCCVVIQNDTLYLTSDKRNEEISVECIETVVVNSKRIGHENGVQLTHRVNNGKDGNIVAFTYLQHDTMETVMNWVNLVLYTKYTVLKRKYPTMIDENIAKILNCGMVKESYMHVAGKGLIYLSLSEARLTCFQHHLDDVPLFQIAVTSVMNLTASQYLDAVACFFDIEANKILSYGDWFTALESVLTTDKIGAMPDDVPKPTFPFSLLKKPDAPSAPAEKSEPNPPKEKSIPASVAPSTTNNASLNNNPAPKSDADKDGDKKPGSYECYPPIGPMGEMGKVFRGELPPDAIKPPPPKNEISRIGIFGEYLPQIPTAHVQLPIKSASYSDLVNQGLATTLNAATNPAMMNPAIPKDAVSCYPPIGGPPQTRKLRCDLSTLTNTQVAQLRKQEALEELRSNPASMTHNSILLSQLAQKQNLFDQARIPNALISGGRFPDADPQLAAQAINSSQYAGWGDASAENILAMSWKNASNGYEPPRVLSAAGAQYQDMWNAATAAKMQTLNGDRNLLASQQGKSLPFGTWNARSPSVDLSQQASSLARNQTWGSGMSSAGIDQWSAKSPTSPIDTFMPHNNRDVRGPVPSGMFGASGGGSRGLVLNGKVGQRTESPASASSNQQNMIIDNLLRQWKSAEQRLLGLIHNSYVPASDMSPAGLDKDSAEHAYTCVSELFELLWKQRYDLALSFLRGFREVFANSIHSEIRNLFIGVGELDTMKQIFLQQGKEKFFSGSSGGPVTWKSPTTPQPTPGPQFDSNWQSSSAASSILSGESPTDFSPWGNVVTPSSSMTPDPWAIGSRSSTRSTSMSSDPWNTSTSIFNPTSSVAGPSFNRAPSRPSQTHAPSFSDHSPTGSAFGSKTSSDSQSPRVVTPPTTTFEPLNAAVFSGLESTLKNILLSNNNENN